MRFYDFPKKISWCAVKKVSVQHIWESVQQNFEKCVATTISVQHVLGKCAVIRDIFQVWKSVQHNLLC